jgi:hypothetical protein
MNPNISKSTIPSQSAARSRDGRQAPSPQALKVTDAGGRCTSPDHQEIHRRTISERAYFMAEERNFFGGDPIQDWLIAEQAVCTPKR